MTFEEAIKKAIRAYFDGEESLATNKLGKRRYDKSYLDGVERDLLGQNEKTKTDRKLKDLE